MNLNVTWEGIQGPEINYLVEYRPYPSNDPFTVFSSTVHTNYAVIPNLPEGIYEVKIQTVCGNGFSGAITKIGGKFNCETPVYGGYSVVEDNAAYQIIRITHSTVSGIAKTKITNVTTNTIVKTEEVGTTGQLDFILYKAVDEHRTYKIEISNVCDLGESGYFDMGTYTVQPITQGLKVTYTDTCNCAGDSQQVALYNTTLAQTYTNPEFIPTGNYNVYVVVPTGTCTAQIKGKVFISIYSGTVLMTTNEIEVFADNGVFAFPFGQFDLLTGPQQGSYVTAITFNFSCS